MARRNVPPAQDDLELTPSAEYVPATLDDARLVDLESEQESPFLRAQKRVSVRRGSLPRKTAHRLKWTALAAALLLLIAIVGGMAMQYGAHSWRFTIDSSDNIEIDGNHNVSRAQIMDVLGGDIGRNIFFVPLGQRQKQLQQISWVKSASVMRFLPDRLQVQITERTPVAFARIGSHISLIDADGVVMDLPASGHHQYSFPVIVGMGEAEPLSTRSARMDIYTQLIQDLDSSGARYSQDLSEVDLSDPEDVKVMVNDPSGAVLVHLGSGNFLARYKIYVTHVAEWRQQFQKLDSVDLRYDRQIIVNPDSSLLAQKPLSGPAARAAIAAGVKPAALTTADLRRASSPLGRKPSRARRTGKRNKAAKHRRPRHIAPAN
ncbi:MAG TPA: FtsQ-type POTRA domain-containing protein [Terriglobales bacterium]|nr:FtsQ-type POTRA domain-containing protein [Terriglobales bacterium]